MSLWAITNKDPTFYWENLICSGVFANLLFFLLSVRPVGVLSEVQLVDLLNQMNTGLMSHVWSTVFTPRPAHTLSLSLDLAALPLQAKHLLAEASSLCCSSSCFLLWWVVHFTLPTRAWMLTRSIPLKAFWTASSSRSRALWKTHPTIWESAAVPQRAPASKEHQQSLNMPPPCRLPQHNKPQLKQQTWLACISYMVGQRTQI